MTSQVQAYNYFVNGKWTGGRSSETFELKNPATGEVIGRVPRAGKEDVHEAAGVARKTFESAAWRDMEQLVTAQERRVLL
jgi:acyl-CoA reductase-like NAD-dependent aldehyde dehydrogenase